MALKITMLVFEGLEVSDIPELLKMINGEVTVTSLGKPVERTQVELVAHGANGLNGAPPAEPKARKTRAAAKEEREERAAIMEHEGGLPHAEAEARAAEIVPEPEPAPEEEAEAPPVEPATSDALPEEIANAKRLSVVLSWLKAERGFTDDEEIVAEVMRLRPTIGLVAKMTNPEERIRRTLATL